MNCLNCGAALNVLPGRSHLRCDYCGSFQFPQHMDEGIQLAGDSLGINCPECRRELVSALLETQLVSYCTFCRGFLSSLEVFAQIVRERRARHSPDGMVKTPIDPKELARRRPCPQCHKKMEAHPYFGGGTAVVDTCEPCKLIWLDAGDLSIIERHVVAKQEAPPIIVINSAAPPVQQSSPLIPFLFGAGFGGALGLSAWDDPFDFDL
jgi:Zn-finger nucleic acid-binding protein